jgi:hypothetical protein
MSIEFWTNDPTILLNKNYIFELWPSPNMNYNQKLNAITRLIAFLTILGFAFTMSIKILFVGVVTIASIFALYKMQKPKITPQIIAEGFSGLDEGEGDEDEGEGDGDKMLNPSNLDGALKKNFKMGNKKNPFSNVLLTDIADNPKRKAAPPSFNPQVDEEIVKSTKKMVQSLNPGIKNTEKQLFGDLYNNWELDQSNRAFYSTANTKVANDQGAFAQFLYGYMPSGKESNADGAFARVQDNYRYTLY